MHTPYDAIPRTTLMPMARRFRSLLPDASADEEDLCQEALLAVWRRREDIVESLNPVASTRRIAGQALGVFVQRTRRQQPTSEPRGPVRDRDTAMAAPEHGAGAT
jgi:DNA-directed RNA polymerase specialized sigma24 family protein